MHVGIIGVGNVGRAIAYTILTSGLASELSVVDIKEGLARAIYEELRHAAAALGIDVSINWFDRDEDLSGADLIVISAGYPRIPGVKMSRRDLASKNASIINYLAEVLPPRNRGAWYVVVTNPVDAMATLFWRRSRVDKVLSTGTSLETSRLRAKLAEVTGVKYSEVLGYVGGEHGENAFVIWSSVRIKGMELSEWCRLTGKSVSREEVEDYVKRVSKFIVDKAGATRYGPAATFKNIIESIVKDECRVLPVATPTKLSSVPEEVFVSVPTVVCRSLGPKLINLLSSDELRKLEEAGKAIYSTYLRATESLSAGRR